MPKPHGRPPSPRHHSRVNVAQSLDLARSLLSQGNLAAAEKVLVPLLKALPNEASALHLLGALRNMQKQPALALPLLERSLKANPDDAGRWNDIGLVYADLQRLDEAIAAYRRCVELVGQSPLASKALDNMGRLQLKFDPAAAAASFRRATEISPEFGLGWYGLAQALVYLGQVDDALVAARNAIARVPHSMARILLGSTLARCGYTLAAIDFYQEWQAQEPNNPEIQHHLRALTEPETAEKASDAYVASIFDKFAASFDRKLAKLDYAAPQLVTAALQRRYPEPRAALEMLDAGCGTGWCGPLLAPWAKRLIGVDLSQGMLANARQRKVYAALHQQELVQFMTSNPLAFDVVVSADTLVYFGNLVEVLRACHSALRAGGHAIFSVEALPDDAQPHRLATSGRYLHSQAHVRDAAAAAGLAVCEIIAGVLRSENGEPVAGWVVVLQKE